MLRTIVGMALGATAPPLQGRRGDFFPVPPPRRAAVLGGAGTATQPRMIAPWGEVPGLDLIAVVTTQPFPREWWRTPRTLAPDDAYVAAGAEPPEALAAEADAASNGASIALLGRAEDATVGPAEDEAEPAPAIPPRVERTRARSERQRQRSRMTRIALLVGGTILSFLLLDFVARRDRR